MSNRNLKVKNVNIEKYLYLLKSIFNLTDMEITVLASFIRVGKNNNLPLSKTYKLFETSIRKQVAGYLNKSVTDINLYIYKLKKKNTIRDNNGKYLFNSIVYSEDDINNLSFNLVWEK